MTDTREIRKQMKEELGYNARQVSVRQSGSSLEFTIRDASISKKVVEEFAAQFRNVHYDYATGEILCGGNTFVEVSFASSIRQILVESVITDVERAIEEIEDDHTLIPVENTDFMVGKDYMGLSVWENKDCGCCIRHCYDASEVAFVIATE